MRLSDNATGGLVPTPAPPPLTPMQTVVDFTSNYDPPGRRFPTAEQILKRIDETRELLDLLQEVHALLEAHPQLERLVGALGKLQQL